MVFESLGREVADFMMKYCLVQRFCADWKRLLLVVSDLLFARLGPELPGGFCVRLEV